MAIPKRVEERIQKGLKSYQKILANAAARDINESDTVRIVADMLADVLGYDRYSEITTELCIRGTFCDLAVKDGGKIHFLIEAKAIGVSLKDNHLRQAQGYAANEGIEWVILTNGAVWQAYRMGFNRPITCDLLFEIDLLKEGQKPATLVEQFYLLSKEGIKKAAIAEYSQEQQLLNKHVLAALLQTDVVLDVIRKELRRINGAVKVDQKRIADVLRTEVIKRELTEGDKAQGATQFIKKASRREGRVAKVAQPEATAAAQETKAVAEGAEAGVNEYRIDLSGPASLLPR